MKVIDLLKRIEEEKYIPYQVKILDYSLDLPYRILTFDEELGIYKYWDGSEFETILDNFHLSTEVEIIRMNPPKIISEYVPLEQKIEKLEIFPDNKHYSNEVLYGKINEIIDKINGGKDER